MGDKVQEAFQYVRTTFFPLWDKKGEWIAREIPDHPSRGVCDEDAKTIIVGGINVDNDDVLHCLLIHEICHAVTGANHSLKWLNRFRKPGDKAKEVGRNELAQMIYEEVEKYAEPEQHIVLNAKLVYDSIEDCVLSNPGISYQETLKVVARSWGLYPEELEEQYRRCKEVYDQISEEAR